MKITNARVFVDGHFEDGGIEFEEKITAAGAFVKEDASSVDAVSFMNNGFSAASFAEKPLIIPGLIDIHTHGAVGVDANDGDAAGLRDMSLYYARDGVTSWCPTTSTVMEEDLMKAMRTVRDFERPADGARAVGIHLEGPFLSPDRAGAQNPEALRLPDLSLFERLREESGDLVRICSLAPELPGAEDFIREASKEVTVSIAHTNADYDTCMRAFAAGASHITHTFNCMPGIHHREPGTIPAALDAGVTAELITDGFHIHPAVIRLAASLFGENLALVSDSLRCAGMPDGDYSLGGMDITLQDGKATLRGRETLAGSSVHLMEGLRRAVRFGVPLEQAVTAGTRTPARVIRKENEIGSLRPGLAADFVILNEKLEVKAVFIGGKKC